MIISEKSGKKIIPVASGKGGVGKSMIAANLALCLAEEGKKTLVIDLDLGGSNLHTCLGIKNTNRGVGNFLSNRSGDLRKLIVETPYEHLNFIPGDVLVTGSADITAAQRKSLVEAVGKLDMEYIILDLGAGTSSAILDFFMISNAGFLVTTAQSTSILNAFGFLKNLVIKVLTVTFANDKPVLGYLRALMKEKGPGAFPPMSVVYDGLQNTAKQAGVRAKKAISLLKPMLVLNMAGSPEDLEMGVNLRELVKQSLDVELGCMGLLYYEKCVQDSLPALVPHLFHSPDSSVTAGIRRMAQKILQSPKFPIMPLDLESYQDTFELAKIEADYDFQNIPVPEEGGPTGQDVDLTDLFEVITAQQKQIEELKGTLRMLTLGKH